MLAVQSFKIVLQRGPLKLYVRPAPGALLVPNTVLQGPTPAHREKELQGELPVEILEQAAWPAIPKSPEVKHLRPKFKPQ